MEYISIFRLFYLEKEPRVKSSKSNLEFSLEVNYELDF